MSALESTLHDFQAAGGGLWLKGGRLGFRAPGAARSLVEALREHREELRYLIEERAAILEHDAGHTREEAECMAAVLILSPAPHFTEAEERELVDFYCSRPRSERLAMHRAAGSLSAAWPGWDARACDLQAMRESQQGAIP